MKSMTNKTVFLSSILFLFISSACFASSEIIIQPGPADGNDTWVGNLSSDQNHGTEQNLYFGNNVTVGEVRHLYIRFDLSDVPEGSLIINARLEFFMHGQNGWMSYDYGVYPALEPWNEQTITWNNAPITAPAPAIIFDGAEWQGNWGRWQSILGFADLAQNWLDNPVSNYGLMIKAVSSYYGEPYIYSSDSDQSDLAPRFILEIGTVSTNERTWGHVKTLFR